MSTIGQSGLEKWLLGGIAVIVFSFGGWGAIKIFDLAEEVATLKSKLDAADVLVTHKFNADRKLMSYRLDVIGREIEYRDSLLAGKLNAEKIYLENQIELIVNMIEINKDIVLEHEHSSGTTSERSEK